MLDVAKHYEFERATRESGKSVKSEQPAGEAAPEAPKKKSAEERERIKAERRAAREAGKPLKKPAPETPDAEPDGGTQEEQKVVVEKRGEAGECETGGEQPRGEAARMSPKNLVVDRA